MAAGFHLLVFLSVVYLPQLLDRPSKLPEIHSVDLVNFVEPAPAPPPVVEKPAEPVVQPKKNSVSNKKNALPAAVEPAQPVIKKAPQKAISLKPLKRKIKKKIKKKKPAKPKNNLKKRRFEEAKLAQKRAEEAARIAQMEAELERKLLEQNLAEARAVVRQNQKRSQSVSRRNSNNTKSGANLTGIEKQFYNAIATHMHNYWQLPEYKKWDKNLSTRVALTISASGKIKSMRVEKSSGDTVFDQFVQKALQSADPLPKIPPAMNKRYFDIGLVFIPDGLQ